MQFDLFGEVEAAEQQRREEVSRRHVAALTCLRDAVPDALQVVTDLRYWRPRDKRHPSASGGWAYIVCMAGLRHERFEDWWAGAQQRGESYGWDRTPADLTTWGELADLVAHDARRFLLSEWTESLTEPRWRDLQRPKELWPEPWQWHPDHILADRERTGWAARLAAWRTLLAILDDVIAEPGSDLGVRAANGR